MLCTFLIEMAKDELHNKTNFQVVGGFISPTSDAYEKKGLVLAAHRLKMCELAIASSPWIVCDSWEAQQPSWATTAMALSSFRARLDANGLNNVGIKLVAGADLIQSFQVPNLWAFDDLEFIVGKIGLVVVERWNSDIAEFLLTDRILYKHRVPVQLLCLILHL